MKERLLEKYVRRWADNINKALKETGCEIADSINAAQNKIQWRTPVNALINFRDH